MIVTIRCKQRILTALAVQGGERTVFAEVSMWAEREWAAPKSRLIYSFECQWPVVSRPVRSWQERGSVRGTFPVASPPTRQPGT